MMKFLQAFFASAIILTGLFASGEVTSAYDSLQDYYNYDDSLDVTFSTEVTSNSITLNWEYSDFLKESYKEHVFIWVNNDRLGDNFELGRVDENLVGKNSYILTGLEPSTTYTLKLGVDGYYDYGFEHGFKKIVVTTDAAEVSNGWVKENGQWVYNTSTGTKHTGWLYDGAWYYLNTDGYMETGWMIDKGVWYFLNSNGSMETGWLLEKGTWYFLNSSGEMETGWVKNGGEWYYMDSNGAMKTGWINDNGTWYYLNSDGSMAYSTTIGGYKLDANGAWVQ